jgi:hypothetical protein
VNAFQPSFKLMDKEREGARVRKRYHAPLTPCDRLIGDPRTSPEVRGRVEALHADLNPVRLLAAMRAAQALVALADGPMTSASTAPATPSPISAFLAGLRTAWQTGEVRPTAQAKLKPKRGRRRPDPLVAVTEELRAWFEADPSCSGGKMLGRLQAAYPGRYPDGLIRTVQRRLKAWRGEMATALVFGASQRASATAAPSGTLA